MRRRDFLLAAASVAVLPLSAWAQPALKKIERALIASFSCGKCGEFDPRMGMLETQLGSALHFVPVAQIEEDYVVRGWYGLRDRVRDPAVLRAKLYKLTQKLMLPDPTIDDLIQFLQLEGIEIPSDEMRRLVLSDVAHTRLMKGVALATMANVEYTPAVVFTRGRDVLRTVQNREMSSEDFVNAVVAANKELKA